MIKLNHSQIILTNLIDKLQFLIITLQKYYDSCAFLVPNPVKILHCVNLPGEISFAEFEELCHGGVRVDVQILDWVGSVPVLELGVAIKLLVGFQALLIGDQNFYEIYFRVCVPRALQFVELGFTRFALRTGFWSNVDKGPVRISV